MHTTDPDPLLVVSYGGGVQSTALLVLAATGYLPHRHFVFSNVGDDSEHPETIRYVHEVAFDYAAAHGIELHEVGRVPQRGAHKGQPETLYGVLMREGSRSLPIPLRSPHNGAPGTRSCTADFKIRVVQRWVREHGATAANPARVAVGISTDEYQRATSRISEDYERLEYPLLHLEHRLAARGASRADCEAIIRDAGLPVPPKSSCYFCPFHRPTVWADMARTEPDLFDKAADLEETLIERRRSLPCPGAGHWPVEATEGASDDQDPEPEDQMVLPDEVLGRQYRPSWAPGFLMSGECRTCREQYPVEAGPDGRWVVAGHNRGPLYLTRFGKTIREVFGGATQLSMLDDLDMSDDGYRCGDVCDT